MPTKTITVAIKADGEGEGSAGGTGAGQFTAYASVFGNVDSYGEVVDPGAFTNTLADWGAKDGPIPLYWSHQVSASPLMNLGHVAQAEEDDTGLLVTGQLDLANPEAKYVHSLIKSKRVNQMSFAYDVLDHEEADDGTIHLKELKLHEVSIVPIGANQETEILDVKNGLVQTIERTYRPSVLEVPIRAVVTEVKAGRTLSAKNEGKIRDAITALQSVLADLGEPNEDAGKSSAPTPRANLASVRAACERMGL